MFFQKSDTILTNIDVANRNANTSEVKRHNSSTATTENAAFGAGAGLNIKRAKVPEDKTYEDYQRVYNEIATKISEHLDYDKGDGYFAQLVRNAWHASATYAAADNSGGSYYGTMIFEPEEFDFQNKGTAIARSFLSSIHVQNPWISRGDLWTLAGVAGVQECNGPKIKWRPGRLDDNTGTKAAPAGRIPDGDGDARYVRDFFSRMGFNDRETVALIGAHVLGRCHRHVSGYDGPWGDDSNNFTNDFFERLMGNWHIKSWDGRKQYEDDATNLYMMLPTDMSLKEDGNFFKYVKEYAKDVDLWFKDFADAYSKLLEKGIEFPEDNKPLEFKTLHEQTVPN